LSEVSDFPLTKFRSSREARLARLIMMNARQLLGILTVLFAVASLIAAHPFLLPVAVICAGIGLLI
jgi:hypothetical protein